MPFLFQSLSYHSNQYLIHSVLSTFPFRKEKVKLITELSDGISEANVSYRVKVSSTFLCYTMQYTLFFILSLSLSVTLSPFFLSLCCLLLSLCRLSFCLSVASLSVSLSPFFMSLSLSLCFPLSGIKKIQEGSDARRAEERKKEAG